MNIKKKLLGSAATIALASMATIGGTFAYFSDSTSTDSKFTNGTIVLKPHEPYLESFNITGWKPGDKLVAKHDNQDPAMVLNNQGTLPMNVFMDIDASSVKGTDGAIYVRELKFGGVDLLALWELSGDVTLAQLSSLTNNVDTTLNTHTISDVGKYIGYLPAHVSGSWDHIKAVTYVLEFADTGEKQNQLQGDVTDIKFSFTGLQYEGKLYDKENLDNFKDGGGGEYRPTDNINDREYRNQFGDDVDMDDKKN
ncbi:TasA family protein [Bacillus alkalisoli]|uniref:TasA family protein n=1 Tax=Bacillus alkalisoli TaxID=2011008 RepID=UPI000C24B7B9|nr:TasA family protein [Bacillus alkalisoli]